MDTVFIPPALTQTLQLRNIDYIFIPTCSFLMYIYTVFILPVLYTRLLVLLLNIHGCKNEDRREGIACKKLGLFPSIYSIHICSFHSYCSAMMGWNVIERDCYSSKMCVCVCMVYIQDLPLPYLFFYPRIYLIAADIIY